jgi:8-oxo-dGTP diphosphatase
VNARPTANVIIQNDQNQFLVLRRARAPKEGLWEVPGGFCDGWEHPRDAAIREAREECGIDIRLEAFVGMYVGTYEFQDELLPVLDCFWLATIVGVQIALDPAEASEYRWVDLRNPPALAFSTMDEAVRQAGHQFGD